MAKANCYNERHIISDG